MVEWQAGHVQSFEGVRVGHNPEIPALDEVPPRFGALELSPCRREVEHGADSAEKDAANAVGCEGGCYDLTAIGNGLWIVRSAAERRIATCPIERA